MLNLKKSTYEQINWNTFDMVAKSGPCCSIPKLFDSKWTNFEFLITSFVYLFKSHFSKQNTKISELKCRRMIPGVTQCDRDLDSNPIPRKVVMLNLYGPHGGRLSFSRFVAWNGIHFVDTVHDRFVPFPGQHIWVVSEKIISGLPTSL